MSLKPTNIVEWAKDTTTETRQGGVNKVEPTEELKNNGSLDGNLALNHFNWMMNVLGLWSAFNNDLVVTTDGAGVGLTKDDHFSLILAFNSTDLNDYVIGFADKVGSLAASTKIISNNTLTFGIPDANGDVPILGATAGNVKVFSLNFKNG